MKEPPLSHPYFHARSSAQKFGGTAADYLALHTWFDESKACWADVRHRAARHHTQGLFACEEVFGLKERLGRLEHLLRQCQEPLTQSLPADHPLLAALSGALAETALPVTFTRDSDGRSVPIRLIGEQHVRE